jgi:hypothetical protein
VALLASSSLKAVDRCDCLTLKEEGLGLAIIVQLARARICPLGFVRVDIDTGLVLIVVPATGEFLTTDQVTLL